MNSHLKAAAEEILENAKNVIDQVGEKYIDSLLNIILDSKRVFVAGAGRSELVMKAFAMRLMHLNIPVYVIGETVTPVIQKDDLVMILSGTGETNAVVTVANIAKKSGAKIALITSNPDSTIGKLSDLIVRVYGRTKDDVKSYTARQLDAGIERKSINPLGTLFETSSLILLDGVIVCLMQRLNATEQSMKERHSKIY